MHTVLRSIGIALLFVLALVALAPAASVNPMLDQATSGALSLVDTEGTIWRGQGTLLARGQRLPLAWTIEPGELLVGRIHLRFGPRDAAETSPRGRLIVTRQGFILAEVEVAVPAAVLSAAPPTSASPAIGGTVVAVAPRLERSGNALAGALDLRWQGARVVYAANRPALDLGTVTASLQGTGDRVAGPVANSGGVAEVRGVAGADLHGAVTVDVLVTPRDASDATLAALLRAVGRAEGAGWRVQWPDGKR
ncbi:MAG: type II secretion system protein N [Betaproteobacteria bacterium]|nr:type II secretion system protein N [Betaproteobacteria bacterium]